PTRVAQREVADGRRDAHVARERAAREPDGVVEADVDLAPAHREDALLVTALLVPRAVPAALDVSGGEGGRDIERALELLAFARVVLRRERIRGAALERRGGAHEHHVTRVDLVAFERPGLRVIDRERDRALSSIAQREERLCGRERDGLIEEHAERRRPRDRAVQ